MLPSLVNMNDPHVEAVMAVVPLHTDRANYFWCNSYTKLQLVRRLSFPKAALAVWLRWRYIYAVSVPPLAPHSIYELLQQRESTLLYADNTHWPQLRWLRLSNMMEDLWRMRPRCASRDAANKAPPGDTMYIVIE